MKVIPRRVHARDYLGIAGPITAFFATSTFVALLLGVA